MHFWKKRSTARGSSRRSAKAGSRILRLFGCNRPAPPPPSSSDESQASAGAKGPKAGSAASQRSGTTHTHMLHRHFWGAQNDVSACVQHRAVGAAPPSDTALAAGEASPIATDDLPAAPVSPAESVPAGFASAAAVVSPAAVDNVPVIADDPSAAALSSSPSAVLGTSTPQPRATRRKPRARPRGPHAVPWHGPAASAPPAQRAAPDSHRPSERARAPELAALTSCPRAGDCSRGLYAPAHTHSSPACAGSTRSCAAVAGPTGSMRS